MQEVRISEKLSEAITAKCGSIVSQRMLWEGAVRKMIGGGLSEDDATLLLGSFRSPRNLSGVLGGLGSEGKAVAVFVREWKDLVDASDYSWQDWVSAYEVAYARLMRDTRSIEPSALLGYLQCTADFGAGAGEREDLAALVLSMLERYGFEGRQGCALDSADE